MPYDKKQYVVARYFAILIKVIDIQSVEQKMEKKRLLLLVVTRIIFGKDPVWILSQMTVLKDRNPDVLVGRRTGLYRPTWCIVAKLR